MMRNLEKLNLRSRNLKVVLFEDDDSLQLIVEESSKVGRLG